MIIKKFMKLCKYTLTPVERICFDLIEINANQNSQTEIGNTLYNSHVFSYISNDDFMNL